MDTTQTVTTNMDPHNFHGKSGSSTHTTGWIILTLVLAIAVIIFLLLWALCVNDHNAQPPPATCFGQFGVAPGVDATPVNRCGTNNTDPCIFARNSLADAEAQCNTLQSICNAFTFNFSTATMKIVQTTNTFTSLSANLFVRQTVS